MLMLIIANYNVMLYFIIQHFFHFVFIPSFTPFNVVNKGARRLIFLALEKGVWLAA